MNGMANGHAKTTQKVPGYPDGTTMTSVSSGGRRKCHYTLPDASEVCEEYDLQTDEVRKLFFSAGALSPL